MKLNITLLSILFPFAMQAQTAEMVSPKEIQPTQKNYVMNRAPLISTPFIKLPPASITPGGWVGEMLRRQSNGLAGHLGEISIWLDKKANAWLEEGGQHGWEEVPYWLRGYSNMAYLSGNKAMLDETKVWIEAILNSTREDGYFGPVNEHNDIYEVWANMLALQILQDWYDYSGDERVLEVMKAYFQWEKDYPEDRFLRHYWENSRGGDNLLSILWLYNRTGEEWLLDVARKVHCCTANWMQDTTLPNWHNVNVAQGFREPAGYYMLSKDEKALRATYNNYHLVRRIYGQVPGGMFGSDENCRHGYIDPRQGTETCGLVEQMLSDEILMAETGDLLWMENLEDVAFNSLPAAFMHDMRALRYITCPNMVQSDSRNHSPSIQNGGPFLLMNPFSSRCCQHNHTMGWPYYAQNLVLASADGGVALLIYGDCKTNVKVADGQIITLVEQTLYPFNEDIQLTIEMKKKQTISFPLYLRIPSWTQRANVRVNGQAVPCEVKTGLLRISHKWKNGDRIQISFPMHLSLRRWTLNKNSISVNYGPLTMSLFIKERYVKVDSRKTTQSDSGWQSTADANRWPSFEIYADSPWNYALLPSIEDMKVEHRTWPSDNYPFNNLDTPLRIKAHGARIPSWGLDETQTCEILPDADAPRGELEDITLVPMGSARLRISAFPPFQNHSSLEQTCSVPRRRTASLK